ncbi:hypothetical protein IJ102_02200 [Candidatus Saccharibacteria bacterium]|nr:hypothetical protein [Candidatus Saccharibacteria bacterium]
MATLFRLDSCTDARQVGSLGAFLAQAARNQLNPVPGFVLPIGCVLEDGASNEILRAFDQLKSPTAFLRASVPDDHRDGEVLRNVPRERLLDSLIYMKSNSQRRGEEVAIIVQKTLNAEVAGTIYSINPATRDSGEILIEAELWMGRTVLSGKSEADMVLIDKRSGALSLESKDEEDICLNATQISLLHSMIRKVERLCSFPVYVEWAFDRGKLYIIRLGPIDWRTFEEFGE